MTPGSPQLIGSFGISSAALLFACLLLIGCQKLPAPPAIAVPAPSPESNLPPVDVYIDDSASMSGFANFSQSQYKLVLTTAFAKITTAGYRRTLMPISEALRTRTRSKSSVSSGQPFSPGFYKAVETPLA
jgi:hypothetical protein